MPMNFDAIVIGTGFGGTIQTLLSNRQASSDQLKELESKVAALDAKLGQLQESTPSSDRKTNPAP